MIQEFQKYKQLKQKQCVARVMRAVTLGHEAVGGGVGGYSSEPTAIKL